MLRWPSLVPWFNARRMEAIRFRGMLGGIFLTCCINALSALPWSFYVLSGGFYLMIPNKHCKTYVVPAGWLPPATQFGWMPGCCWNLSDDLLTSSIHMLLTRILLVQWLTMRVLHRWGNLRAWSTHIPSTAWIAQCDLWSINAFLRALEGARRLMLRSMAKSCNADPAVPLAWLLLSFSMLLALLMPWLCLRWLFRLAGCSPLTAVSTTFRAQYEQLHWSASDACLALDPLAWTPWHVFRLLPWLILMMRSLLWTGLRRRWALWRIRPLRLPADSSAPTG